MHVCRDEGPLTSSERMQQAGYYERRGGGGVHPRMTPDCAGAVVVHMSSATSTLVCELPSDAGRTVNAPPTSPSAPARGPRQHHVPPQSAVKHLCSLEMVWAGI